MCIYARLVTRTHNASDTNLLVNFSHLSSATRLSCVYNLKRCEINNKTHIERSITPRRGLASLNERGVALLGTAPDAREAATCDELRQSPLTPLLGVRVEAAGVGVTSGVGVTMEHGGKGREAPAGRAWSLACRSNSRANS